jgi:hypothetical protein
MGYRQREKRRRKKKAATAAQERSRETGSAQRTWWLTFATRPASCNRCGGKLRQDREIVYRHVPCEVLCVSCARAASLSFRPSLRWERRRRARV